MRRLMEVEVVKLGAAVIRLEEYPSMAACCGLPVIDLIVIHIEALLPPIELAA
jgi:hypothetical protein